MQNAPNWITKNGVSPQEAFLSDMKEMIESYQNVESRPVVYVGLSPRLTVE